MKFTPSDQALELVEQHLSRLPRFDGSAHSRKMLHCTVQSVAAATGLTLIESEGALTTLMARYKCRLMMNRETGEVEFVFTAPLLRRGSLTVKETFRTFGKRVLKGFEMIYRASLGAILLMYSLVYAVVAVVLVVRFGFEGLLDGFFDVLYQGVFGGRSRKKTSNSLRVKNFSSLEIRSEEETQGLKPEGFMGSVFNFVFGPVEPIPDPLKAEKNAAFFIHHNQGKLTAGHIVALTGWCYDEAESHLAEYIARFGGEAQLSDTGAVYGEFADSIGSVSLLDSTKGTPNLVFYDEEQEQKYLLTGNSDGRNAAIIGLNVFNIGMACLLSQFFQDSTIWQSLLVVFPFTVSVLYFLIPLARLPIVQIRNERQKRRVLRKHILRNILNGVQNGNTDLRLWEMLRGIAADSSFGGVAVEAALVLVAELQGEVVLNEDGNTVYRFTRLSGDLVVKE